MSVNRAVLDAEMTAFSGSCRGAVITPGDADYDVARVVWNGGIDRRPAVIVRCEGVADVIDAVAFARRCQLPIAVRGGGHNVAGNSICDDGIVIDLGPMRDVRVDQASSRVRAGGGATIGMLDRETQAFGLAVPLGVVTETGIAGLTLCGGHSWLTRKHGFACDNLISADVVTADGRYLVASEEENPDLFWALRGGGGNFGIVTSFEFRAHAIGPDVSLCAPFYPMEEAGRIFRLWRDYLINAPDDYTAQFALWSIPVHPNFPEEFHNRPVCIPIGVHSGDLKDGEAFIQPMREFGVPLLDLSGPTPYIEVQKAFDPFWAEKASRLHFWKSLYIDNLDDEAIDKIVARGHKRPDPWSLVTTRIMGGAGARVASGATALGGRSSPFMLSIDTGWTDETQSDQAIAWTREFWDEMRVGEAGRAYLNFVGDGEDNEEFMKNSYGAANYKRLVQTKKKYDPENVFRLNQNIRPD